MIDDLTGRACFHGILFAAALFAAGCSMDEVKPDPAYAPSRPVEPSELAGEGGAIYRVGHGLALFEDRRARQVGDILTVLLVESTDASKSANTSTNKENSIAMENPTLFGSPFGTGIPGSWDLEMGVDTKQDFKGGGSTSQSNRLKGNLGVTVAEVLPNGNLLVRGEKILSLTEGTEFVRLSGIVRAEDISPQNTVLSTHVANAQISYGGKGSVSAAAVIGWLAKFFLMFAPL